MTTLTIHDNYCHFIHEQDNRKIALELITNYLETHSQYHTIYHNETPFGISLLKDREEFDSNYYSKLYSIINIKELPRLID